MEIPILVEPISDNGFRATSGGPLGLQIEAPTREEAIDKLRELIGRRIAGGAEVVGVEIGGSQHPLATFAGMLKGDPLLQPWKDAMEQYRRANGQLGSAMIYVLDTDILVLFQEGQTTVCQHVLGHGIEELATTVITVEEQLARMQDQRHHFARGFHGGSFLVAPQT